MSFLAIPPSAVRGVAEDSVATSRHAETSGTRDEASWPTYLNGNQRAAFSPVTLSKDLNLAWTYRSQAKPEKAWSGPRDAPIEGHEMRHRVDFDACMHTVIDGGRVYFGSTVDHRMHCVDGATGRPIWSFYADGPIRLAPTLAFGNVYFGSDDGQVYCLRANDGELIWKMRVSGKDERLLSRGEMISRWPVRTGVLIDENIAYFGAGVFPHETVFLCAADAVTGELVWRNDRISQQDAGRNDLSPQGYMLCNDTHLYVPSGRSLPVAVDKATGEIVFQRKYSWRSDAGGVVGGTKALLGDGQVYAGGPHHFLAMDDQTGDVGAAYIGGRQMVLSGEFAYLSDGDKLFCVNRDEHAEASREKQKWFLQARADRRDPEKVEQAKDKMQEYAGIGIVWQQEMAHDDALIATDDLVIAGGMNEVVALDRDSGQPVWRADVEGNVKGLAATASLLTVSTEEGNVYGFSPRSESPPRQWPEPYTPAFEEDGRSEFYTETASEILRLSGQRTGYCLVAGSELGRLAHDLARQSSLYVIGVEPDAAKAAAARHALERAGAHATRVTIVNLSLDELPFSNYFANLIVSETQIVSGRMPCPPEALARFLKPCGGVTMLASANENTAQTSGDRHSKEWMTGLYQADEGELTFGSSWAMLQRGRLPGAGEWTHQYGNAANTSFANDQRIRDGLGVLWYGDPGPSAMINRHEAAGAPLSTNGRMFIQGTDSVMAYDAYNGTFLWEYQNPGAIRTGVFNNRETHNLAASDDYVFVAVDDQCRALDTATGEVKNTFTTPTSRDGVKRSWAYVAHDQGQLFGTSTIRKELEEKLRRRGLTVSSQTDSLFAVDVKSGETLWSYHGDNILHTTIAIGPNRVYFIDSSISPEQRQALYLRDKSSLRELSGDAAAAAEAEMKELDVRLAVALDRKTGEKLWERPVNVTDTTDVSAGGGSLTVMYERDHLILCGANANGHYWKQFLAGEFEMRKLLVLNASTGDEIWSKNANYMNRPAIVEGTIYAEPWAFDMKTGEPKTRQHPLTGKETPWRYSRPGHHCGVITATPNMMFFRSGFIGYYDLYHDSGTRHFAGQRLGCWVNAIPGNGLVMIPEASAGCVCQFSIASTVVLEPKTTNHSWGIFSAVGESTPVQRIAVNFGAPGDRKDPERKEWIGFPRPNTVGRLEFELDLQAEFFPGGGWSSRNADFDGGANDTPESSDEPNWLFASVANGLKEFRVPLLGSDDLPAKYDMKLYFVEASEELVRTVDVVANGRRMDSTDKSLDPKTDASTGVFVKEVNEIDVQDVLRIEMNSPDLLRTKLAAVEITRCAVQAGQD